MGKISEENATQSVRLLREGLRELENRLVEHGFDTGEVEDWIFNIIEILGDWQEMHQRLAEICNVDDLDQVPGLLNDFTWQMVYPVTLHINGHLENLQELMNKRFPENLDE